MKVTHAQGTTIEVIRRLLAGAVEAGMRPVDHDNMAD